MDRIRGEMMKNIWVKYTIRHGGGHHGLTIHYIYFEHEVTHDDLYHQCDILCNSMNQARAKWKIIKKRYSNSKRP